MCKINIFVEEYRYNIYIWLYTLLYKHCNNGNNNNSNKRQDSYKKKGKKQVKKKAFKINAKIEDVGLTEH